MVTPLNSAFDCFAKEELHEECGVFGIYSDGNVNPATNYATTSLVLDAKDTDYIDVTSLVENKKVVPMQMIVTDKWGKKMTYEFNVTISL